MGQHVSAHTGRMSIDAYRKEPQDMTPNVETPSPIASFSHDYSHASSYHFFL